MTELDPHDEAPTRHSARTGWRMLVRSFLTLLAGEGAARVLGLATVLLLARRLGPGGFGLVTFGTALVAWFGVVADAGTTLVTTRDIAREPRQFRSIAEPALGLRLAMSGAAAAILIGGALAFARSTYDRNVYIAFAIALPATALNLRWMVLGVRGARLIAFGNIAAQAVLLAGVLLFVSGHQAMTVAYLTDAAEFAAAGLILALLVPRFGLLRPRIDFAMWRATLRQGFPLMVSSFARGIIYSFDLLVITRALGPPSAGYYGAASRPVLFFVTAIGLFYVSFLASYSAARPEAAAPLFRRTARVSLAAAVPIAIALTAGAELIVPLLFGDEYKHAAPVLAILAWKIPFSALSSPYNGLLIVENRRRSLMWNNIAGASVNIVGDLIAAPTVGIVGVAVVNLLATATILGLNYRTAVSSGLAPRLGQLLARTPAPAAAGGTD
jgi:PST family polysaccharide transporter